jgi:hypothetical protein
LISAVRTPDCFATISMTVLSTRSSGTGATCDSGNRAVGRAGD